MGIGGGVGVVYYRAEDGQKGDGFWPPQARNGIWGMRSRVEI